MVKRRGERAPGAALERARAALRRAQREVQARADELARVEEALLRAMERVRPAEVVREAERSVGAAERALDRARDAEWRARAPVEREPIEHARARSTRAHARETRLRADLRRALRAARRPEADTRGEGAAVEDAAVEQLRRELTAAREEAAAADRALADLVAARRDAADRARLAAAGARAEYATAQDDRSRATRLHPTASAEVRAAESNVAAAREALEEARAAEQAALEQVAAEELRETRQSLREATAAREQRSAQLAQARSRLRGLARTRAADDRRVRAAERAARDAERALAEAQQREQEVKQTLPGGVAGWLPEDPEAEIERLNGDVPVVLFPVRVETRFHRAQRTSELRVRIYPDEILANEQDPRLTSAEVAAAHAYWQSAWDPAAEAEAWRVLLLSYRAQRAAWLVRATEPVNLAERPAGEPEFPAEYADPALVPETPARPVGAHVLPDRWLVLLYRGGVEVRRAVSGPVDETLILTPDPNAPEETLADVSGDGLLLDPDVLWAYDLARAEEKGMALRIPLSATDAAQGFDRVLVLGVKSSLSPAEGTERLEQIVEGHHYGRGFALVRQGTPTNNTSASSSGFPPEDPDGSVSFAVERQGAEPPPESDGARLMDALGLTASLASSLDGATRTEWANAAEMNDALWPVTFGYALQQMMAPVFSSEAIAEARSYFVDWVRGRGPLPAFRIGGTPYGVVPVGSLAAWQPEANATGTTAVLPDTLRRLYSIWNAQVPQVPRVGATDDPDADLIGVLGLNPSAREVRVRQLRGLDTQWNLFSFLGLDTSAWLSYVQPQWQLGRAALAAVGHPEWTPRLVGMTFDPDAYAFSGPLVADELSEEEPLPGEPNYIAWLATASVDDIRSESFPVGMEPPTALLYRMLRHALLLEYGSAAFILHARAPQRAAAATWREPELVGIVPGTLDEPTVWQRLDTPVAGITDGLPVKEYLQTPRANPALTAYRQTLAHLSGLPTAELDRLFTETLDTCSHRLDAWITSLAAQRLAETRARQAKTQERGSYLAAFGWVEDLRQADTGGSSLRTLPDGRTLRVQAGSGGYVHAPSHTHAAAAAVLRNGYLTRPEETRAPFAVDLSSARVRLAQSLLDGVRNGLPLAAVLGYLFERALHDRRLDVYIQPLRNAYPMPVLTEPASAGPSESITPRDVVNGWNLYQADDPFSGISIAPGDRTALHEEVGRLRAAADALADLLTADSVYQIVRGNTASAASSLDALGKGARPPDPEVARAARGGTALTHRVAVVLGGDAAAVGEGWADTPRARAEPYLNGWLASLLGDPANVRCVASYLDPTGSDPENRSEIEVRLSELGFAPLDVLAIARGVSASAAASELDRRVSYFALAAAPEVTDVQITYTADAGWDRATVRTFPELLELARAVNRLLGGARALRPEDLMLPESATEVADAQRRTAEADTRAAAVRTELEQARDDLLAAHDDVSSGATTDLALLRTRLTEAALFGIPGAIPATRKGDDAARRDALLVQAESALGEMETRIFAAASAADAAGVARAVFGGGVPFLPRFDVVDGAELALAITEGPALVGDPLEVRKWHQRAARVHAGVAAWRRVGLYAGALDAPLPDGEVAQLPYVAGAKWAALPFASEAERPPAGRVSLMLHRAQAPATTDPWVGLMVDEWSELIPNATELTGIGFHYDDPGAEAPQAVLIAVSPVPGESWTLTSLVDTLNETLDLAKARAVDGDLLGRLGQLLPAAYLASNASDDTVQTDFSLLRVADPVIAAVR